MSAETAAHLQSCAECRREHSTLRGIVGELRSLPHFAAPPDLRARIRNQVALEMTEQAAEKVAVAPAIASTPTTSRTTPRQLSSQRSWFPGFFIPRWATYSLSGALATAFLLFVARDINPDFTPGQKSYNTSSSEQQDAPTASGPAKPRVAPAPQRKTPSASNNRANRKIVSGNGAVTGPSNSQKAAPVPQSSTSGAPSSTRSQATSSTQTGGTTAESTTNPARSNSPDGNSPATNSLEQSRFNQLKRGVGKGSAGNNSDSNGLAGNGSAPKIVASEETSQPRLPPSLPRDSAAATGHSKTTDGALKTDPSKTNEPTASTGLASAPLKTDEASSSSAKRFARLELLPPSNAPSSLQKVPPARGEDASSRRPGSFRNAPPLPKSATNGESVSRAGGFGGNASGAGASGAGVSDADTMSAPVAGANASGSLYSAPSSTRSDETSEARSGQDAVKSDGDASAQPAERASRSRVGGAGGRTAHKDATQSSASTEAAPSTMQDAATRSALPAPAPTARATARGNASNHDSEQETPANPASAPSSVAADATATPLQNPLLPAPLRRTYTRDSSASAQSANGLRANGLRANGLNEAKFSNATRQNARLIVTPRQNVGRARVVVAWIGGSARAKVTSVVWRGAARRNQQIAIFLTAPRGNKNRRAQVSLQGANARGEWQTLDTVVLNATPISR